MNNERTVAITGAGSGLGRAMALAFASASHAVVINDLNIDSAQQVADEITADGGLAIAHSGDVSDEEYVGELSGQIKRWSGRLDVLVNNAGLADTVTPTIEQNTQDWQRVVDVCMRGPYLCSRQLAADFMLPQRSGRIVNISSIAGLVGLPLRNAYSSSKAALEMMTRTLAAEWASQGITVNAVAPGYIRTPMLDALIAQNKVNEPQLIRRIPAGQLGDPSDIADAVLYLASDAAKYVTGVSLPVDGGWCAFGASGDAFPDL